MSASLLLQPSSPTANVRGPDLALADEAIRGLCNGVGLGVEAKVSEHHRRRQDERGRVGLVRAHDVLRVSPSRVMHFARAHLSDVSASGLEEGVLSAKVASGDDTRSTDKGGSDVTADGAVQLGGQSHSALRCMSTDVGLRVSLLHGRTLATHHDHHVELLRSGHELHRGVVDNHRVKLDAGVAVLLLGDPLARVEEETVSELHDVGLVHARHFLPVSRVHHSPAQPSVAPSPAAH